MASTIFDETHVLHELKHYLPSQTPLKDFIHHNTLHAFQHMKFYDAIFKAQKMFGYQVTLELKDYRRLLQTGRINPKALERAIVQRKGIAPMQQWYDNALNKEYDTVVTPRVGRLRKQWKTIYHIDLDNLVQPILFRVLCSYLDQGIAIWKFPVNKNGFLASLKELEGITSLFKTKRAKQLLLKDDHDLKELLTIVAGDQQFFEQYLFDQQFSHQGWSGLVASVEDQPHTLLDGKPISLRELIIFELLLEIDALDYHLGKKWQPLTTGLPVSPLELGKAVPSTELQEIFMIWQDAFEWSYYDEVLTGIRMHPGNAPAEPSFQAIFCIDERECSLRRHFEAVRPDCETLGTPGFFGVEFYFQPQFGKFYEKLCPAPVTPKYLIKETDVTEKRKHEILYTNKTHTFLRGTFTTITLGYFAAVRLLQTLFRPRMSPAISNAFTHMNSNSRLTVENADLSHRENDLQVGFTIAEMTTRVEGVLRTTGLVNNFSPLIYAFAHGSSSANNPHHSAHDCGACSGRPGSVNARVFAHMANHPRVRDLLKERGIMIPGHTQFIGGLHDTAADQIECFDEHILNATNAEAHKKNKTSFEKALDLNAKERSRRFASINTRAEIRQVRKAIQNRSVSMFEPRPELGHGTNSLCIIGSRNITKDLFLDRRAFMNSYDHKTDPDGKLLTAVMRPIGLVCGGINLEYYFSRVDNYKLGAGTKLPHNVMGLIGVANSSDGDLRPGLPVQMIEVHDPVRLLILVEHHPAIVHKAIQSAPEIYEWYINEWVHLFAFDPANRKFFYFRNGEFVPYDPIAVNIRPAQHIEVLAEQAKEMETNHIIDATKENLPVYKLN